MLNNGIRFVAGAVSLACVFAALLARAGDDASAKQDTQADAKQDAAAKPDAPAEQPQSPPLPDTFGILLHEPGALPGYNLVNPGRKQTYLFDNDGRLVHTWTSEHNSGASVYLLDNGHLFRPAEAVHRKPGFQGPAAGGRLQEFDWEGNLVWDFEYHSEQRLPHHDAIKLANGNALLICWERISDEDAIAQGRRPETVKDSHLQPDCLVEIKPTGPTTGEIVWEWRTWDHLIQDFDKTKANYGKVSDHPELFDVNYIHGEDDQVSQLMATKDGREKLRALGYVGNAPAAPDDAKPDQPKDKNAGGKPEPKGKDGDKPKAEADKPAAGKDGTPDAPKKDPPPAPRKNPDWMHVNAVAYNADLDQIALSSPHFNEIWIIDHSTTTAEARGHKGGRWGKGGDILYRWGNPRAYRNGTLLDQRSFYQHNVHWIPKGYPGAGHLLIFNNGSGRKPEEYSSVDELIPPTDKQGNYLRPRRGPYGPDAPIWSYTAPEKKDFFSWFISGTQRLPNGNTLINSGAVGVVFEVTADKEVVWKFANPFKRPPPTAAAGAKRFEAIPGPVRDQLNMVPDQRKQLDELDTELVTRLDKILSAEELKSFAELKPTDAEEFNKHPAGTYLTVFHREEPKLTEAQRTELQAVQQEFSPRIAAILTSSQKNQIAEMKKGPPPGPPGGNRGPQRKAGNTLFRATRYPVDHPAFAGRTLTPGKTVLEIEAEFDQEQAAAKAAEQAAAAKPAGN